MHSNFTILTNTADVIVLKDLGPWDIFKTITNDAEAVVSYLYKSSQATGSKRIVYYDSEEEATELFHDGCGNFTGFGFAMVS